MRHPSAIGVIGAIGLAVLALTSCTGDDDDARPPDTIDLPGDGDGDGDDTDDVTDVVLEGLTGGEVAFADYEGRPVVVNFFASTCAPCVQEMPAIESVKEDLGEEVAFVGVATNDPVDDAVELAERTGVTWDLARDPRGAFIVDVGGVVLPTTVLVDANGAIAEVHSGELDADELRDLLRDELGVDA